MILLTKMSFASAIDAKLTACFIKSPITSSAVLLLRSVEMLRNAEAYITLPTSELATTLAMTSATDAQGVSGGSEARRSMSAVLRIKDAWPRLVFHHNPGGKFSEAKAR